MKLTTMIEEDLMNRSGRTSRIAILKARLNQQNKVKKRLNMDLNTNTTKEELDNMYQTIKKSGTLNSSMRAASFRGPSDNFITMTPTSRRNRN